MPVYGDITITLSRKPDRDDLTVYMPHTTAKVSYIAANAADTQDRDGLPLLRLEDSDQTALWLTGLARTGAVGRVSEVWAVLLWVLGIGFLLRPGKTLRWQCSSRDVRCYRRAIPKLFPRAWFHVLRGSLRKGNPYPSLIGETDDEHIVEAWQQA